MKRCTNAQDLYRTLDLLCVFLTIVQDPVVREGQVNDSTLRRKHPWLETSPEPEKCSVPLPWEDL